MNAETSYNDLIGSASADIADKISKLNSGDYLKSIAMHYKLDETRYKAVGISLYPISNSSFELLCIDKFNQEKVKLRFEFDDILKNIFKHFNVVLFEKSSAKHYEDTVFKTIEFSPQTKNKFTI